METFLAIVEALKATPLPTILVVAGIGFFVLAIAGQVAGKIEVPPARQKWAAVLGAVFFLSGVTLHLWNPTSQPIGCDTSRRDTSRPLVQRQDPPRYNRYVEELQHRLLALGYDLEFGADGLFGSDTERAVKEFQARNKLDVDGEVGERTWACLYDPHAARSTR